MKNNYLISVITPSYNMSQFIEKNILSVLNQRYANIEHIIIDGNSNDRTIEILKNYKHLKWISEPDNGQSEAYNKALKMAKGDFVLCLNADDYLLNNDVLQIVVDEIDKINIGSYSAFRGQLKIVDSNGHVLSDSVEPLRYQNDFTFDILLNEAPAAPHQAIFYKTDVLRQVGGFTEDLHFCMDIDSLLKISKIAPIYYSPIFISALQRHTQSKSETSENNWKRSFELLKIRRRHGGAFIHRLSINPIKHIGYKFILGSRLTNFLRKVKSAHLSIY